MLAGYPAISRIGGRRGAGASPGVVAVPVRLPLGGSPGSGWSSDCDGGGRSDSRPGRGVRAGSDRGDGAAAGPDRGRPTRFGPGAVPAGRREPGRSRVTDCPTTPASRPGGANRGEGGITTSRPTSPTTADSPGAGAKTRKRTAVSTIDRHRRHVPGAGHADGALLTRGAQHAPYRPGDTVSVDAAVRAATARPPSPGGDTERGGRRRRAPSDHLIVHHRRPTRPFSRGDGAPTVSASPSADPRDWRAPFITVVNIRLSALRLPCALRCFYTNQAHLSSPRHPPSPIMHLCHHSSLAPHRPLLPRGNCARTISCPHTGTPTIE